MTAPIPMTPARTCPALTDVELCAWIAQAAPGDVLEYHRGALALDRLPSISTLPVPESQRLDRLAERAFAAAEQHLVHLVQRRLGPDQFSYLAVARPKPARADAALATLLLAEAA